MYFEDFDPHEDNLAALEMLHPSMGEGCWRVLEAKTFSSCIHCGATVKPGETFYWHTEDRESMHEECVDLAVRYNYAMSKDD